MSSLSTENRVKRCYQAAYQGYENQPAVNTQSDFDRFRTLVAENRDALGYLRGSDLYFDEQKKQLIDATRHIRPYLLSLGNGQPIRETALLTLQQKDALFKIQEELKVRSNLKEEKDYLSSVLGAFSTVGGNFGPLFFSAATLVAGLGYGSSIARLLPKPVRKVVPIGLGIVGALAVYWWSSTRTQKVNHKMREDNLSIQVSALSG